MDGDAKLGIIIGIIIALPFIIVAIPALFGIVIGIILFFLFCGLANLFLNFFS